MKKTLIVLGIWGWMVAVAGFGAPVKQSDVLFQQSTMSALNAGVFGGSVSLDKLKGCGDFGLGTFDGLDGEMIVLNGRFYQVTDDGKVQVVSGERKAPFAVVKFFQADIRGDVGKVDNYHELTAFLETFFPSQNYFYAVQVDGVFDTLKIRSVPRQEKPYPGLAAALKGQKVYTHENVKGTLVGFWTPQYAAGINAAGWHFHFISRDRKIGGHLLDCRVRNAAVDIDVCRDFQLDLPDNEGFRKAGIKGVSAENP